MKKNIFKIFIVIFLLIITFSIFSYSNEINDTIYLSINLFIKNIFPSLFPMFVISSILVAIKTPKFLGNIFSNIMFHLFKVKGEGSFVFFMSMISGFPSSSIYIKELLDKKLITINDANKILTFTFFSNPLFIINSVGIMFLNNKRFGIYILLSNILGNIITGILFRNLYEVKEDNIVNLKKSLKDFSIDINNAKIFKEFLIGIKSSLKTLMNIFGIITCFLIITKIVTLKLNLNSFLSSLITGLLEMTSGLKSITNLNINENIKLLISTFFISFGGLSVHAQILNCLDNYKINYFVFLISRIIHASISVFICLFFYRLWG